MTGCEHLFVSHGTDQNLGTTPVQIESFAEPGEGGVSVRNEAEETETMRNEQRKTHSDKVVSEVLGTFWASLSSPF